MSKGYHFPGSTPVVSVGRADVYHFRWPADYGGWAIFTVNDSTGEFSIQSDWGNFAHRWNPAHLGGGRTLTEFLAIRPDHHYVVNKLSYDNKNLAEIVDESATLHAIRTELLYHRRNSSLDKEKARTLWELAEEFADAAAHEGIDAVYHNADFDELIRFFPELYECLCMTRPILWTILERELLPRFAGYIRENVLPRQDEGARP